MPDFLFDLPLALTGPAIIGGLCLFALTGFLLVRRFVLPHLRVSVDDGQWSGSVVQCMMVFYGLAAALIAVNVLQNYSNVSNIVSNEATALGGLYRDVSGYPQPIRSQLQSELRNYTLDLIHTAWPLLQHGKMPVNGIRFMNQFQAILVGFEPATDGQKILHAEALRAYNNMIQARRMRLDAGDIGLPGVMWSVILAGAIIGLSLDLLFQGGGCAVARHFGDTAGRLHGPGHFHDPRPRPAVPWGYGDRPAILSSHLRPTDEALTGRRKRLI